MTTAENITAASKLTKKQTKTFGPRFFDYYGDRATLTAEVRYDDDCNNGHNSFAITGEIKVKGRIQACGCLHDEIAQHFPELKPLLKWHLSSSDGPMYYIANTVYHASDMDCWRRRAGDPSRYEYGVRFNDVPVIHRIPVKFYNWLQERAHSDQYPGFTVSEFAHDRDTATFKPHYSLTGFAEKWHECPFRDKTEAEQFAEALNTCKVEFLQVPVEWSEGKPRELDAARRSAVWPEATDEELTAPGLEARLKARLPKLLEEFRAAVESLGFTW